MRYPDPPNNIDRAWATALIRTLEDRDRSIDLTTETGTFDVQKQIDDASSQGGGFVQVPPGIHSYDPPLMIRDGVRLSGGSRASTILVANPGGTTCIELGIDCGLTDIHLTSANQRTSGPMVRITQNACYLDRFSISNYFIAIAVEGSPSALAVGARINDGFMFFPFVGSSSLGVSFQHFSTASISNVIMAGPPSGPQPGRSIQVRNGDVIYIDNVNATLHGTMAAQPDSGENTYSLTISKSFFDNATTDALVLSSILGGNVMDTTITQTWAGLSGGSGMLLDAGSGAGVIDGLEMSAMKFVGNGGDGLLASGANARNINLLGGTSTGNALNGLRFVNSMHWGVIGTRVGDTAARGPNGGSGILTSGTCDYYRIVGVDSQSISDTATGVNKIVGSNI